MTKVAIKNRSDMALAISKDQETGQGQVPVSEYGFDQKRS
jgi:hypothetical protein